MKKGVFIPRKYGAFEEETLREREAIMSLPATERPGNFRSVANGDFSEEEIVALEKEYGCPIKRPA